MMLSRRIDASSNATAFRNATWAGFEQLYFGSYVCKKIDARRRLISAEELCSRVSWDFYFKMHQEGTANVQSDEEDSSDSDSAAFGVDLAADVRRGVRRPNFV